MSPYSTIPKDFAVIKKPKGRKKKPSTNVIYVNEASAFDKVKRVKRIRASELHLFSETTEAKETVALPEDPNLSSPYFDTDQNSFASSTAELQTEQQLRSVENRPESLFSVEPEPEEEIPDNAANNLSHPKLQTMEKDSKVLSSSKINKNKTLKKMFKMNRSEGRITNFNNALASLISVCMSNGNEDTALNVFNHYLHNQKYGMHKRLSIISYNELLKAFSLQGNYEVMESLRSHLRKKNAPQPNVNTFAHYLACLGRLKNSRDTVSETKTVLKWMEENKVTIQDILTSAVVPGDSLAYCLEAIQRLNPDKTDNDAYLSRAKESMQESSHYRNPLLNSLNESLFTNKVPSPVEGLLTWEDMNQLIQEQINNEMRGFVRIPNIISLKSSKDKESHDIIMEKWEIIWRKNLREHLQDMKNEMVEDQMELTNISLFPFLVSLDDEDIIDLIMTHVTTIASGSELRAGSINYVYMGLGNEYYKRFLTKYHEKTNFLEALEDVYRKYCRWYLNPSEEESSYIPRIQWDKFVMEGILKNCLRDSPPEWPITIKVGLGKLLFNLIFSAIRINYGEPGQKSLMVPAFYRVTRALSNKKTEQIKPSPIISKLIMGVNNRNLIYKAGILPMVSPPLPWISPLAGASFTSKVEFVRLLPHAHQQTSRMKENGNEALYPVMDSLNQLGSLPWKINSQMLDFAIKLFLDKGSVELDIPPQPSLPPKVDPAMTFAETWSTKKKIAAYWKKKREGESLWYSMLYKLSLANYYRDKMIWLPINMDFRGRAYTIHPHLTQFSDDVTRSMLIFAQGKKLGKDGLYWLKLHLINLTGLKKKCRTQERIEYCDQVMDHIEDSADNPLDGKRWWTESDEPWQTLAACKELVAALRSGDPENYVSHLPIHQDGSCNGLQHYAALGRDEKGATSVNLRPSAVPQDVYTDVVVLVEEARKLDAADGVEIAKALEGLVQRKIIKQTVMTTVYGVTRFGAILQIFRKLKDMELNEYPTKQAAAYLASKTFSSIGTLFSAAKEIQDWFTSIAEGVSKYQLENVEWVTPIGFPVVQPYIKASTIPREVGKSLDKFSSDIFYVPNPTKQKNAFPPNFIHSLDSSHMMLTSIYCQHAGVMFISIHDCFWTHAATVPVMNRICREQFVALHSLPILENMAEDMMERYKNCEFFHTPFFNTRRGEETSLPLLLSNLPKKGNFDLERVLESVYFFN